MKQLPLPCITILCSPFLCITIVAITTIISIAIVCFSFLCITVVAIITLIIIRILFWGGPQRSRPGFGCRGDGDSAHPGGRLSARLVREQGRMEAAIAVRVARRAIPTAVPVRGKTLTRPS